MQSEQTKWNQDREREIVDRFEKSPDFNVKHLTMGGQEVSVFFLNSLVDFPKTLSRIQQTALIMSEEEAMSSFFNSVEWESEMSVDALSQLILEGKLVCIRSDGESTAIVPERALNYRSVATPVSENPLQSSFDAFTEDLASNIGILRKKIISTDLIIETRYTGSTSPKKLAVVYMKGTAKPEVIQAIEDKLNQNSGMDVKQIRDLLLLLGQPKFSIIPTHLATELPMEAAQNVLEGKVLILLDQYAFAYSFPAIVSDFWSLRSDGNYPYLFQMFFRFIRTIGIIVSLTMPGLYIVLNSVNPELLRIQLAIAVAKSRMGVPYPALVELLLMLLLLEMVIEASIRLPKSIGPTITMVGGIILGQAVVQAKLVSNLLIIILAASTIANFTIAGFTNTIGIRMYKYIIMIASSFFGIWGLEASIIWLSFYLASIKTFTVPYLSLSVKGRANDE